MSVIGASKCSAALSVQDVFEDVGARSTGTSSSTTKSRFVLANDDPTGCIQRKQGHRSNSHRFPPRQPFIAFTAVEGGTVAHQRDSALLTTSAMPNGPNSPTLLGMRSFDR